MTIGDKIPEVLGIDQDGREIKAADYRGRKIVLYSYPKANTLPFIHIFDNSQHLTFAEEIVKSCFESCISWT